MSIEDVALKRDDSDIIQFDNIFSNDLAKEQQLDLLFGEKEDDDIIRMIESRLFDSEGNERVFVESEEDLDSLLEEDDEEGGEVDISNNDADGDKVDDDMEEAPAEEAPAEGEEKEEPSAKIEIEIDADNVNISPDAAVKEDGDVNVTAQVANISPKADEEDKPMTGEDLSAALTTSDDEPATPEEIPAPVTPGDNEPAPAADQKAVNGADDVVGADFDNTRPVPAVGASDEVEPAEDLPVEEGVEQINTASELDDALNAGLDEPAPAPEETSPTAEPEDPSTEVAFADSNDMEEKSDIYGENAEGAVRPEEDTVIGDDAGNITHGEAPKNANDGIPETEDPAHKDTSETQVGFLPRTGEELDAAMDTVDDLEIAKEAKEPEDPNEENVENDAEASLLGIEPTLTAGDLDKMFNVAEEDPNKDGKYSQDLNEGGEPEKIVAESEDEQEKVDDELAGDPGDAGEPTEEKCGEKCNEAECPKCDSEPEEDQGEENIDNGFKHPEKEDDLAKMLDNVEKSSADATKAEDETISGEEGVVSKDDEEWQDAVAKDDITSDAKVDAAKSDTGYKDNIEAGDQDADKDEINEACEKCETAEDLENMFGDIDFEAEAEPDPTDGEAPAECGSACNASCTESDLTGGISDEKGFDGGNKSDDNLSSEDFETQVTDPKNDGDDKPIVDDAEQAGTDKEDGGAINTADANDTIPPATGAELEAALEEIAADSTEIIPDEVEAPKEDLEYDETVKTDKVAAPGNDGSDEELCVAAETAEDLDRMLEDFEDQVEGISDDEVFEDDINTGLEGTPEDEELELEIDDEAIDIVEGTVD